MITITKMSSRTVRQCCHSVEVVLCALYAVGSEMYVCRLCVTSSESRVVDALMLCGYARAVVYHVR